MNWPQVFSDSRFAVLGLGENGLPAAEALAAMGADVSAWDDDAAKRDAAAARKLKVARPSEAGPLDALVLSPGIPHRLPAPHPEVAALTSRGVVVTTDAELLYRAVRVAGSRAKFLGITGTNGKSTTTALTAHILGTAGIIHAAGANLGPAALSLPLLPDDGIYCLEMSSYMLERITALRFDAAAMLNLTPDHLDRHGDMEGYAEAKRRIFARQDRECTAVVGIDDAPSRAMADDLSASPARLLRVSGHSAADIWADGRLLRDSEGLIVDLSEARALPGAHNAQNAAAAAALAQAAGVPRGMIAEGIRSYPGLPHRQAEIAAIDGIRFIDDSKATNADAAARALGCYDRLIWIAGGIGKAGGIASLAPCFPRIARAFLIGRDAAEFAATLAAHGVAHEIPGTLDAAVPAAFHAARDAGIGTVLLSPAAASFDQFANYGERGRRFAELARALDCFEEMR
ncbi:MAG TPA: UDP-N-acetylmuramoyl-L-alanine--D-glutamate ligase [Acetobacteraceae bacterium]|nr:UDP-N-acetylmuramoyl-L-alanine--D-glutamate ligase [Acetobacteraceae bacterium]